MCAVSRIAMLAVASVLVVALSIVHSATQIRSCWQTTLAATIAAQTRSRTQWGSVYLAMLRVYTALVQVPTNAPFAA